MLRHYTAAIWPWHTTDPSKGPRPAGLSSRGLSKYGLSASAVLTQNRDMQASAPPDTQNRPDRNPAVFEHPLNERMRNFLRLEFLYRQATHHHATPSPWSTRAAVISLLEILTITGRGDPRSDVLKDLERQMVLLRDFQNKPGVDTARLQTILSRLTYRRAELQDANSSALSKLRENEFLAAIKHRSAIPGGTCEFDLPDYSHWLHASEGARQDDFGQWLNILRPLCESVIDLLWVTRENAVPRTETAIAGSYHIAFEKTAPIQLLRISLPPGTRLFPQISGSHHRSSIRFLTWLNADTRPVQATEDISFLLTCCS